MIDVASNLCQISLAERTSVVARFNKMGRYVYHLLGTLDCTLSYEEGTKEGGGLERFHAIPCWGYARQKKYTRARVFTSSAMIDQV
jgi:hypothetical protein